MNKETLFESIGHIDDELLLRTEKKKSPMMIRLALAAACVVFLGVALSMQKLEEPSNNDAYAPQEATGFERDSEHVLQMALEWKYVEEKPYFITDSMSERKADNSEATDHVQGYVYVENGVAIVWIGQEDVALFGYKTVGLDQIEETMRELEKEWLEAKDS